MKKARLILPIALLSMGAASAPLGAGVQLKAEDSPSVSESIAESTASPEEAFSSIEEGSPSAEGSEIEIEGKTLEDWAETIKNKTILGVSIGTIVSVLVGLLTSLIRGASDRKTIAQAKSDIDEAIKLTDVLTDYIKTVKEKESATDEDFDKTMALLSAATDKIEKANESVDTLKGDQEAIERSVSELKAMLLAMAKSDEELYARLVKALGGGEDGR